MAPLAEGGARGLARNEEAFKRFSDATDLPLTVLALVWLPVLIVPLVTTLPPDLRDTFAVIDYTVWAAFAVEYLVRIYLVPDRKRFFTHHLVDLAVIVLPMLRPLRAARLLRLLNLGRIALVGAEGLRRAKALLTHRGLHFVLLAVLVIVFAGAALVFLVERHSAGANIHNYGTALWWAIVTVTTVGYGDHTPVTGAGRGVAVFLMLVGIGLIGTLTATVASFFVGQQSTEDLAEVRGRLERIEAMMEQMISERVDGDGATSVAP